MHGHVRTVHGNLEIHEEMLSLVAIHGNIKGKTSFDIILETIFSFADREKFSTVCTDFAKVITGKNDDIIGHLMRHNFNIYVFYCIIHQQALLAKNLNLMNTMKMATKIVNKIRGDHNALNHRKFKDFLDEINAEYGDLLLYTEIRWLSKGRFLQRLFSLREEVILYVENNSAMELNDLL